MVRLAVFDDPEAFPRGVETASQDVPARAGEVIVIFEGLSPGRYAVAVHHDENGNGDMDTGFLGLPQEGYSFSNDATVFLGPPPFREAAVHLPGEGRQIVIRMNY